MSKLSLSLSDELSRNILYLQGQTIVVGSAGHRFPATSSDGGSLTADTVAVGSVLVLTGPVSI